MNIFQEFDEVITVYKKELAQAQQIIKSLQAEIQKLKEGAKSD